MLEIRRCCEKDIVKTGQFYDDIVLWLNEHVNYPKWIYQVYPSIKSVEEMTVGNAQYIYEVDGTVRTAFGLNNKSQGAYYKGHWSQDLKEGSYMVIHALAIDPDIQRQGLGSKIIQFCIDRTRLEGYKAIRVDIVPTNTPARMLFEKNGFSYIGDVDLELGIGDVPLFSLYEFNIQ